MHLNVSPLELHVSTPFQISRGTQTVAKNLFIELAHDGLTGWGEGAPDGGGYYGENRETMRVALQTLLAAVQDDPLCIEESTHRMSRVYYHGHGAAKAAIDMALHDMAAKVLGVPLYRMLGLSPSQAPPTSFTIAIEAPEVMAQRAAAAADFPVLKLKVGTENDEEIIRRVRAATHARIRVDANGAWSAKDAVRHIHAMQEYDIELIEQPVPASDVEGLRFVRDRVSIPVVADESCVTIHDVARVADAVDGINIKLAKCGGIRNAIAMIHAAREHHLLVMLGCMISSSLSITAAAHLASLTDFVDLDGALLLADDPFNGVTFEHGRLVLPERSGLGVESRSPDFPQISD